MPVTPIADAQLEPIQILDGYKVGHEVDADTGCWNWQGSIDPDGYGKVTRLLNGESFALAHRFYYTLFVGPIPDELALDHLCRNRRCVNPDHLEPVTWQENILRSPIAPAARQAQQTHCKHGHEFTPENTVRYPSNLNRRYCRTCRGLW